MGRFLHAQQELHQVPVRVEACTARGRVSSGPSSTRWEEDRSEGPQVAESFASFVREGPGEQSG